MYLQVYFYLCLVLQGGTYGTFLCSLKGAVVNLLVASLVCVDHLHNINKGVLNRKKKGVFG